MLHLVRWYPPSQVQAATSNRPVVAAGKRLLAPGQAGGEGEAEEAKEAEEFRLERSRQRGTGTLLGEPAVKGLSLNDSHKHKKLPRV